MRPNPPLEGADAAADTDSVASTHTAPIPDTAPRSPLDLLVESDRQLASLVKDVGELERALQVLHAEADRLEAALARRDAELAAAAGAAAAAEAERDAASQQLERIARGLGDATAELRGRDEQVAALETEVGALRREIAQRERGLTETAARLAAAEAALQERERALQRDHTARAVGEAALAEAQRRAEELADEVEAAGVERDRLSTAVTALQQRLADQEAALADAHARAARGALEAEAAVAERDLLRNALAVLEERYAVAVALPPLHEHAPGHVRVLALPSGYTVTEHEEPCPAVGDVVAVGDQRLAVARIGRSPLLGDGRPCAFVVSV